ncbi:hypothetical protein JG687_00017776 [Phytophthora cactorum]|uniref:Uncharacterized protein n=1 Tax=Phytophthora cactorum TaxID=29920 RepID=A0A8T1TMH0_9STRA|nr:hypothetical protein JG687_00017776 [Phytophthora cactorum]
MYPDFAVVTTVSISDQVWGYFFPSPVGTIRSEKSRFSTQYDLQLHAQHPSAWRRSCCPEAGSPSSNIPSNSIEAGSLIGFSAISKSTPPRQHVSLLVAVCGFRAAVQTDGDRLELLESTLSGYLSPDCNLSLHGACKSGSLHLLDLMWDFSCGWVKTHQLSSLRIHLWIGSSRRTQCPDDGTMTF